MQLLETEFHEQVDRSSACGGALERGGEKHVTDFNAAIGRGDVEEADYGNWGPFTLLTLFFPCLGGIGVLI